MEGSWQGLLFTHESWPFYFHKVCWKRFCGQGIKNILSKSVIWPRKVSHGSGRDTCNLKKHIQHDSMILHLVEKKTTSSSVESGPDGQGMGKKKAWLVSCRFVFKS